MIYESNSVDERYRRCGEWHEWFAWHPVRISPTQKVWLERLDRRGKWATGYRVEHRGVYRCRTWQWEYRLPHTEPGVIRNEG